MSQFSDNQFDDFEEEPQAAPPPKRGGNRNFILAIGALGAISLLTLIVLVVVGVVVRPARSKARLQEAAVINAGNTATALAATQLALAQQIASSVTLTPSATSLPSQTPVVAIATATPAATIPLGGPVAAQDLSARTQTVSALLTQASGGGKTPSATPRSTALPSTGFADEVGLPLMIGIAALLIVVIFLVRRVRLSSSS